VYHTAAGKRSFKVVINGQEVLSNFDIVAAAGGAYKPIDKSFPVNVSTGTLVVQFVTLTDAAMVNAIEVLAAGSPPSSPPPSGSLLRVNTGGATYTDSTGAVWSADSGYSAGNTYATSQTIAGTTMSPLYQTVRYDSKPFQYSFSVPNGTRTVNLRFAEVYFSASGQRVFNVVINGQTVLSSFDIVAAAGGPMRALDKSFSVNVTGGQIVIQFAAVRDAAMVNAIDIQ
jgi:hypothetical protein